MNRVVAIVGAIAAILLLTPYLGISLFGSAPSEPEQITRPEVEAPAPRQRAATEHPKGKQTMVEDILQPAPHSGSAASSQKLSDIERLLKPNGEDK